MKKLLWTAVLMWAYSALAVGSQGSSDSLSTRPKVGLVLSGGGARGAAHIGVIRRIEEMKIPVDYVAGTSMGAIIGALYAIGYSADEMDSLIMAQDWKILLSNDLPRREQTYAQRMAKRTYQINIPYEKGELTENSAHFRDAGLKVRRSSLQTFPKVLARPGLIDGHNLMHKFTQLTYCCADSVSFDSLPRPFACIATDLVTGREVVIRQGYLAEAMRASMSIPGVFYPIYKEGQVWVDGGIVNNYPVDVVRAMGAEVVIGVEVNSAHVDARELHSFTSIFERLIGTLGTDLHERNVEDTDILIQPKVKHFPVMGFDTISLRQLMDTGYQTAIESNPQLEALRLRMACSDAPRSVGERDSSDGAPRKPPLLDGGEAKPPHHQPESQVSVGLRLDSEDAAAALLHINTHHRYRPALKYNLTTRVSTHPWISARMAYAKPSRPRINLSVHYGYTRIPGPRGKRSNHASYHSCGSDLYLSHLLSRNYELRAGIRYDNFWVRTHTTYAKRQSYAALYALWRNDLFDVPYTPTKGYAYGLEISYNIKDKVGQGGRFLALQGEFSTVIPLGGSTALLPSLYVRGLCGSTIPTMYQNAIGGYLPQRYLRQQLPFVGLTGCEYVKNQLILPRIGLRQRLLSDMYVTAFVNYAYSTDTLTPSVANQTLWGLGLQLSYDTTMGPLQLSTHWNSLYHRLGLYFSFGFEF